MTEFAEKQWDTKLAWLKFPVALWLAVIVILAAFGGGLWAGAATSSSKIIIKGGSQEATISGGQVQGTTSTATVSGQTTGTQPLPSYLTKDVNFELYWKTWSAIKEKYFNKNIPDTKLFYGSMQGMVAGLGDPYSMFMTPSDASQFHDDLNGSFQGIGAEIAVKNNQLLIVAPLDDSPAIKAGLKAQDWIVKINGTSTDGMSSQQAVNIIRGPKNTPVTLTIYRSGWDKVKDIVIVRDQILVKSVSWEYKNNGKDVWIKIRQFNDDTVPLLNKAVAEFVAKPEVKGVILDLRNDPGGYLDAAVQVAGQWDGNQVVVSEKNRDGVETDHIAYATANLVNYKTVVLIDGGSASASEIVAGALQDWKKATLVGMKSFGKGSVQDLTDLPDGSQIKLTIAKWYTPSGRSIDEHGIEPDVKIDLTEADYNKNSDPQLDKALELLK